MKKNIFFILIAVLVLSCNSLVFSAEVSDQQESKSIKPASDQLSKEKFDDFDQLVDDAIRKNVLPAKAEFPEPKTMQVILAKVGMPFLNLYIFSKGIMLDFAGWIAGQWGRITSFIFSSSNQA